MAKNDKTLNDLFEDTLKDIYYAEKTISRRCLRWQRLRILRN